MYILWLFFLTQTEHPLLDKLIGWKFYVELYLEITGLLSELISPGREGDGAGGGEQRRDSGCDLWIIHPWVIESWTSGQTDNTDRVTHPWQRGREQIYLLLKFVKKKAPLHCRSKLSTPSLNSFCFHVQTTFMWIMDLRHEINSSPDLNSHFAEISQ